MDKKFVKNAIKDSEGNIIDLKDGEIINSLNEEDSYVTGSFITDEELNRRRENFKKKEKAVEIKYSLVLKENNELKQKFGISDELEENKIPSNFIWAYFKKQQELYPELKNQDISRLIYISTYIDFNTNILVDNKKPILPKDINKYIRINKHSYKTWITKMLDYGYLKFEDNKVIVNRNFFNKGKIKKYNDKTAMRIFTDMVRELYNSLDGKEHHKMGIVMQLIPYINPYFNCLSKNPHSKNKNEVVPMKLGELNNILGFTDQYCIKLGTDLLSIRLGSDKKRIAMLVALDDMKPKNMTLIINSKLFFGGNASEYHELNDMLSKCLTDEL